MSKLLNALGLMRVSEHEELIENSVSFHLQNYRSLQRHCDDLKAKFKLAATDLAKQAEEIEGMAAYEKRLTDDLNYWRGEANALRPDAQKWRDYLKRSRDRRAGKAVKS